MLYLHVLQVDRTSIQIILQDQVITDPIITQSCSNSFLPPVQLNYQLNTRACSHTQLDPFSRNTFPAWTNSVNICPIPAKYATLLNLAMPSVVLFIYIRLYATRLTRYPYVRVFNVDAGRPATLPAVTAHAKSARFSNPLLCAASHRTI